MTEYNPNIIKIDGVPRSGNTNFVAGSGIDLNVSGETVTIVSDGVPVGAVDSVNGQTGVVVLDTGDITEATDANYVSDAQLTVIGNTSGINTGDNATNTQYSGLAASKQDADANLTTIAGLTATTDNFIVSVASAWASRTPAQVRTTLALVIGTNVQAWDADLDSWAGKTAPSGTAVGTSDTQTLTNKRITERVVTTTDDASSVINIDTTDVYELTAVANATTFTLTGTPTDGQKLIVRYKDAGSAKGLTWTGFTAIGVTLPTTTTTSKWGYVGCIYNLSATTWHAVAVATEV